MKQIIISVGREFGSGGHIVAQKIAEHYDIPIFNKELLEEMARKEGYSEKALEKYDEKPVNFGFMPLPYAGGNIPIEQEIAMKQFEFIKNKADAGESFVIVGRCADEILAYNPNLVSVFITGDRESKIARVMDREGLDRKQAVNKMKRMDKTCTSGTLEPKSSASANSATPAWASRKRYRHILPKDQYKIKYFFRLLKVHLTFNSPY